MKLYYILVAYFVFSYSSFAQNIFLPGKIITTENKELNVFIKYAEYANTPQQFYYKLDESSKSILLNKSEFNELEVFGKVKYVKKKVIRNTNNGGNFNSDLNPDLHLKEEEIILEELVSGYYNLYYYFGESNSSFFYASNDKEIKPLYYKEYLQNDIIKKNYHYLVELEKNIVCNTDLKIKNKLKSVSYSVSDLVGYFTLINNCINGSTDVNTNKKDKSYLELKTQLNLNRLTIYDNNMYFNPKPTIGAGLELEYHFPFYNYLLSVSISPSYMRYENKAVYYSVYPVNSLDPSIKYDNQTASISYSSISAPINLKFYPYRKNNFKASIEATLFPLLLYTDGNLVFENKDTYSVKELFREAYIATGFKYKNYGLTIKKFYSQGVAYHVKGVAIGFKYSIWNSKIKK